MANTTAQRFSFRVFLALALTATASAQTPPLTTEFVIANFPASGSNIEGSNPGAGVISDGAGNLYGTTLTGGTYNYGVVYKVNSGGETVLQNFKPMADGGYPSGSLIRDAAGNLYGTCMEGPEHDNGSVYRLSSNGEETVLHGFPGFPDGGRPDSGVIDDGYGNLYGTTAIGGASGRGAVFKLDATGRESILYSFKPSPDGSGPISGLFRDRAANLFGTTFKGGTSGLGIVFKLDPMGQESVLHNFSGPDGANPNAVIGDDQGNLYGTTYAGGSMNAGVAYKLDSAGAFTILHSFTGGADGENPSAGLIRDSAGNLYGNTSDGGKSKAGVVFKIDTTGQETILYTFTGGDDGGDPEGTLSLDAAGNLYGTTYSDGKYGGGVIFKLTPVAAAEDIR